MNTESQGNADYFRRMLTAVFEFMLLVGLTRETTASVVNAALKAASPKSRAKTSFARPSDLVTACLVLDR